VTYNPNNPKKLIRLLDLAPKISTREGFIDEYFQRLPAHHSNGDAYWSVEHDHMTVFSVW
jgi:hypothetical protein